jgi:hypothetical protein
VAEEEAIPDSPVDSDHADSEEDLDETGSEEKQRNQSSPNIYEDSIGRLQRNLGQQWQAIESFLIMQHISNKASVRLRYCLSNRFRKSILKGYVSNVVSLRNTDPLLKIQRNGQIANWDLKQFAQLAPGLYHTELISANNSYKPTC